MRQIPQQRWTLENRLQRLGYELDDFERQLAKRYAEVAFMEYQLRLPPKVYQNEHKAYLDRAIIKVIEMREERELRQMLSSERE